jgi:hypothetical protein
VSKASPKTATMPVPCQRLSRYFRTT